MKSAESKEIRRQDEQHFHQLTNLDFTENKVENIQDIRLISDRLYLICGLWIYHDLFC